MYQIDFYFLCFACYSSYTTPRDWSDFLSWTKYSSGSKVSYALTRFKWAEKKMQNCFCNTCWKHRSQDLRILFSILVLIFSDDLPLCSLHFFKRKHNSFRVGSLNFIKPSLSNSHYLKNWESKTNKIVIVLEECTV